MSFTSPCFDASVATPYLSMLNFAERPHTISSLAGSSWNHHVAGRLQVLFRSCSVLGSYKQKLAIALDGAIVKNMLDRHMNSILSR